MNCDVIKVSIRLNYECEVWQVRIYGSYGTPLLKTFVSTLNKKLKFKEHDYNTLRSVKKKINYELLCSEFEFIQKSVYQTKSQLEMVDMCDGFRKNNLCKQTLWCLLKYAGYVMKYKKVS